MNSTLPGRIIRTWANTFEQPVESFEQAGTTLIIEDRTWITFWPVSETHVVINANAEHTDSISRPQWGHRKIK